MRRGAAGLAASLALLSAAPALAASRPREGQLQADPSGTVAITWHGDPARGCADAGVCGVRGSLVYTPGYGFLQGVKLRSGQFLPSTLALLSPDREAVVRVRRDTPGGGSAACVDSVSADAVEFAASPLTAGRYLLDVSAAPFGPPTLSAGRCAGPVATDLKGAFPSGVLDTHALARHSGTIDMAGTKPLVFGPYSGEMVSTVAIRVSRLRTLEVPNVHVVMEHRRTHATHVVRVLRLSVRYTIAGSSGSLLTTFGGDADPVCRLLDSCGVSGTDEYRPTSARGEFEIFGEMRLRGSERGGYRLALHALRSGRLQAFGLAVFRGSGPAEVTSTVTYPDATTCRDTTRVAIPPLEGERLHKSLRVALGPAYTEQDEALRTHCPGPTQSDVVGPGPLAGGGIALADLGDKSVQLVLSRPGAFSALGYSGTRSGSIQLSLVRHDLRVRVVKRKVRR